MEQLKIFENEEFGSIRTVTRDGEVWFVGKDVAEALGFTNSRDAIATHVFDDDKGVEIIDTLGGKQKMTAINESGLYALVFGSRLSKEMRAILNCDERIVIIDDRVTNLENCMTIDYGEQVVLGDEVNKAVLDALGGKHSNAYNEIGKKVFAECNRDLKHYFHVNARNNVPKKRYYEALEYIQEWKPCTNTQIQIRDCNAQVCMP